jgi:hypothetical protein
MHLDFGNFNGALLWTWAQSLGFGTPLSWDDIMSVTDVAKLHTAFIWNCLYVRAFFKDFHTLENQCSSKGREAITHCHGVTSRKKGVMVKGKAIPLQEMDRMIRHTQHTV